MLFIIIYLTKTIDNVLKSLKLFNKERQNRCNLSIMRSEASNNYVKDVSAVKRRLDGRMF